MGFGFCKLPDPICCFLELVLVTVDSFLTRGVLLVAALTSGIFVAHRAIEQVSLSVSIICFLGSPLRPPERLNW